MVSEYFSKAKLNDEAKLPEIMAMFQDPQNMVPTATTLPLPYVSSQNLYDVLLSVRVRIKDHWNERYENGKRNSEDDADDERLFIPDVNYQANQEKDHATSYDPEPRKERMGDACVDNLGKYPFIFSLR